jgi:hypothetical protein
MLLTYQTSWTGVHTIRSLAVPLALSVSYSSEELNVALAAWVTASIDWGMRLHSVREIVSDRGSIQNEVASVGCNLVIGFDFEIWPTTWNMRGEEVTGSLQKSKNRGVGSVRLQSQFWVPSKSNWIFDKQAGSMQSRCWTQFWYTVSRFWFTVVVALKSSMIFLVARY